MKVGKKSLFFVWHAADLSQEYLPFYAKKMVHVFM